MKKLIILFCIPVLIIFLLTLVSTDYYEPIAYYQFEGTLQDNSTNGKTLTVGADNVYATGKLGVNSRHYAGKNSDYRVNDNDFAFGTGQFTIALWFNSSSITTNQAIFSSNRSVSPSDVSPSHYTLTESGGNLAFRSHGPVIDIICNFGLISNYANNSWHRIVIARDGLGDGQVRCYADGRNIVNGTFSFDVVETAFYVGHGIYANFTGHVDELLIYKGYAWNPSDVTYDWNNGVGREILIEEPIITITLISPANKTILSSTYTNLTANFNITSVGRNYTWKNATFYTWKAGAVYNKSLVSLSENNTQNTTTVTGLTIGNYQWNVVGCYANNTYSGCSWAASNFTFELGALTIGESYNSEVYETSNQTFQVNISLVPGTSLISAFLWYNGTLHPVSDIKTIDATKVLTKSIDIPVNPNPFANTTRNFHWGFTFSNAALSPQNTTIRFQNISFINLQLCNTTYTITSVNFTTKDEKNPNPKINASFHTNWEYWIGGGNTKKTYSFEDTSITNSSFKFCIFSQDQIFKVNTDMEYSSTGFPERTRYLRGATLSNITQEVELFLLNESQAQKFFFTLTQRLSPVSNAIITISKYDVGVGKWITIGIRKSDSSGKFIEYLELDKEYQFSISKNGIFLGLVYKTSACSSVPCEIKLELTTALIDLWSGYYDIYATNVAYNLSYNPLTKNVTFTFVDLTGLAQYFRLQVNKISYNQTGEIICNKTAYTTSGILVCDLSGYSGNFRADAFISRSPEKRIDTRYAIIAAIRDILGREGLLFALIILITIGLIGAWSPVVGIILVALAMFFSVIMGFVAITFASIVLIFVLAIFLIIKFGRGGGV